jgi:hypothetical protein
MGQPEDIVLKMLEWSTEEKKGDSSEEAMVAVVRTVRTVRSMLRTRRELGAILIAIASIYIYSESS